MISETEITRAIVKNYLDDFLDFLELDVAIAGAGPSGLVAARYIAEKGFKVGVFERKLSVGGGIWGGGMLFPKIVIQKEATRVLDDFEIKYKEFTPDLYVSDAIEVVSKLVSKVCDFGAKIFNCIVVEDIIIRENTIAGFVINWSPVEISGLHVDPLAISAKICIDATGHDAAICRLVEKKVSSLKTKSGKVEGEKSMWSEISEKMVVENTKEVYPNLYVCGMAANTVFGAPRMGPIFGGMFLSGKKVAELIISKLKGER